MWQEWPTSLKRDSCQILLESCIPKIDKSKATDKKILTKFHVHKWKLEITHVKASAFFYVSLYEGKFILNDKA